MEEAIWIKFFAKLGIDINTNGLTFRAWLKKFDYDFQYRQGMRILKLKGGGNYLRKPYFNP